VNIKSEKIWKEAVQVKFDVLSWNLSEGTEKTTGNCQDS
jgi:hypothetical protein